MMVSTWLSTDSRSLRLKSSTSSIRFSRSSSSNRPVAQQVRLALEPRAWKSSS